MKGKKGCKQETLCWTCLNYSRCSWARGIPVKGWTATPLVVIDAYGNFDSFIVHTCPFYKENMRKEITAKGIGHIIGRSKTTILRYVKTKDGRALLRAMLKRKGYILQIINDKTKHEFCVEKKGGNENNKS